MSAMNVSILVRPDGVQSTKMDAAPLPFDFERSVLLGGAYLPHGARALCQLFMLDMFPNNKGKNLFKWESLTPHVAITIAATYHTLNSAVNSGAIRDGVSFLPVNDTDITQKLERTGIMTPKQVETRYLSTPSINT
jgi:hypothetical protein